MRHLILNVLLLIALTLQGAVAVGGEFPFQQDAQQHCAGHAMGGDECTCCPDGSGMGASCTVQCSAAQEPVLVPVPARVDLSGEHMAPARLAIPDRFYAPLIPPPIS